MKKIIVLILMLILALSLTLALCGCGTVRDTNGNEIDKQSQQYIDKALSIVNKEWKSAYSKNADKNQTDKTVEIINARIIHIKENGIKEFKDVDAVVEFDVLSDYYGSAPYYSNIHLYDTVVFYKDGSTKTMDIFKAYTQSCYVTDYSDVIENVVECGEAYNTNKIKVEDPSGDNNDFVEQAIETLKNGWAEELSKHNEDNAQKSDGTLKICNTRLISINQNSAHQNFEKYFGDIQAIVEFEVYSDFYGSAPYYVNAGINDSVIIHTDGTPELASHYIRNVGSATYVWDFSQLFSDVLYFGDKYNQTFNLFGNEIKSLDDDFFKAVDNLN